MAWDLTTTETHSRPFSGTYPFSFITDRKWLLFFLVLAFASGFVLAKVLRPPSKAVINPPSLSDYEIDLPEGQIVIDITDPRVEPELISRLTVERHGSAVTGVPQSTRELPARSQLVSDDLIFFKRQLKGVVYPNESVWKRANSIRSWLARADKQMGSGVSSRRAREEYEQMHGGQPVLCGNLADIYVALCEAAGITARTIGLSAMVRNGQPGLESHAAAEIWVPEMGGWVYEDPTFDCYWEVDQKPASALTIHNAVLSDREINFQPQNQRTQSLLSNYYIDPRLFFRHISYEYRIGNALLYYADERVEPFNMSDRNWVQTDNADDVKRLDVNGMTIVDKRGEVAPGIFVQLIGQKLFVRDRRAKDHGLRIRLSQGTVLACAYENRRAEAMGIFDGRNLVRNGLFRSTEQTGNIAAGWHVSGDVYSLTVLGGQGMATESTGKLWQPLRVTANRHYVLYARLSVTRGNIVWSLADPDRGFESKGQVEPGRMTEIISDVVPSRNGSLNVSFEAPGGGAFRVIDVIVGEAPRFSQEDQSTNTVATDEE
jgi:Transglutaminase-like superfamily